MLFLMLNIIFNSKFIALSNFASSLNWIGVYPCKYAHIYKASNGPNGEAAPAGIPATTEVVHSSAEEKRIIL